jgi:glucose/arabinose dehydrogenase
MRARASRPRLRRLAVVALGLLPPLVTGSAAVANVVDPPAIASGAATPTAGASVYRARLVVGGLQNAAAFAFAPDGRIFIAERITGDILVYDPATGRLHPFATVSHIVGTVNTELGLDGIVLHPDFARKPLVYAYATRTVHGTPRIQIIRYRTSKPGGRGIGVDPTVIYRSNTAAGRMHVGGRMLFHRGDLYVVVGDGGDAGNAQDRSVERGKILRMTARGAPAAGNPFGTRVWSYGHRNSFGFDFDPQTGRLWETENGPECNDEINRIVKAGNYAWGPHETCSTPPAAPRNTNQDGPRPRIQPLTYYASTIGPTGLAFCHRCGLGRAAAGAFFFGAFNTGEITRVQLTHDRRDIASTRVVLRHSGHVLSIETSPRGTLYFSDGKGIYRLTR